MAEDSKTISFTCDGRVGRLVLNRAAQANAFDTPMMTQFHQAIQAAHEAADILVISAAGADFSTGRDREEPRNPKGPFDSFSLISAVNAALRGFPGVSLSVVQGRAFGFGVGIAMKTDLCLAAEGSRFMLDEVKNGIPPMFIMAEMTAHLPPKHVADLILCSREISAAEALAMGLVSRVAPDASLQMVADDMVAMLASRSPDILRACKRYLQALPNVSAEARDAYALTGQTAFALAHH